jgi:hypothetical protein
MRRLPLLVFLLLLVAHPVAAQVDVDDIAAGLRAEGTWAGPGTSIGSDLQSAVDGAGIPIYVAVFAEDTGEDPSLTAERVSSGFGSGTFFVLTPDVIGVYSVDYDDAEVESALDAAWDAFGESDAAGVEAFERAITGEGGFPIGTVLLVGVVGVAGWAMWRGRRSQERAAAKRVAERRTAIGEQVDDVANDILALSDQVQVADDEVATDHYRKANGLFTEVQGRLPAATNELEFESCSTDLTKAEWHLEAVEAILEGRPIPEEPTDRPIECFFHQHKAGVEAAEIETPAGKKQVSVCRDCAARLRSGQRPEPRTVAVGGTRIPAGRAPRSFGGGGMDIDVFDVLAGGRRTSYDWRGPSVGGFGGPARRPSRSTPRRSSSRSTSRSSSRSSSRSRGGGRASRRRRR